jgi:hypothetical protein
MCRRWASGVAALLVAVALAGCQDPYATDRASSQPPAPAAHSPAEGRVDGVAPGAVEPPPRGPHPVTSATARAAARRFALRWVNWDWRSAAPGQRTLARLASGPLAGQLRADAKSAAADASLRRDKPGSRGAVVAISLQRAADAATGVVVTREQTYTGGRADLGGARYRVYLVALTREPGGWGVSRWAPQQ